MSLSSESYPFRCLSFAEMDDLIDFQPDKELCGGRDISEEQRCPLSMMAELPCPRAVPLKYSHLPAYIIGDLNAFLARIVRYTYHRGEFVEDKGAKDEDPKLKIGGGDTCQGDSGGPLIR